MIFYSIAHLKDEVGREQLESARLVMTGGCFDIFHLGHVHLLELCRKLGDMVIVVVNSDLSVTKIKGPTRPVQPKAFRATVVEACGYVDHVLVWESVDVVPVLQELEPAYWVKGRRKYEDVLERDAIESYGGDVVCYWPYIGVSTSRIIEDIVANAQAEEVSTGMDAGNIVEIPDVVQLGSEGKRLAADIDVRPQFDVTPHELRRVADELERLAELPEGNQAVFDFGVCRFKYIKFQGRKGEKGDLVRADEVEVIEGDKVEDGIQAEAD